MIAPSVLVGTAGWNVPSRHADRVPPGGTHLARYAGRLNAVEINSSFYRPHRPTTYARWAESVPDVFRFSVKLPRTITHERRMVDCRDLAERFLDDVAGLGPKLGALLVQLPPSLAFEPEVATAFLTDLMRRNAAPVVCEPRHASWFQEPAAQLLAQLHVARVAADPAPAPGAGRPGGWHGIAYYRLHGSPRMYYSDYDPNAVAAIARRLAAHRAEGVPAWCVFDNTAAAAALGNALDLMERVAA